MRPTYCASRPSGNRMIAPATMGMDSSRPFWAGVRLTSSLMKGAMAPFMTQITNENVR
ncbi:hypothetical protein FQZ97_952710 [compost metagenome]